MKCKLIALTAVAAFAAAPIASQAADKEVQNAKCSCPHHQREVALIVSGQGIGQPVTHTWTVSKAMVGQGVGVTFFTGQRETRIQ